MRRHTGSTKRAEKAKEAWGNSLNSLQDVYRVFTKYTSGAAPQPGRPRGDLPSFHGLRRHNSAGSLFLASLLWEMPAGFSYHVYCFHQLETSLCHKLNQQVAYSQPRRCGVYAYLKQ